jgi:hypothetical protein
VSPSCGATTGFGKKKNLWRRFEMLFFF